jgi:predicted RNase H-like nuclease (RuvC/YqgF family)
MKLSGILLKNAPKPKNIFKAEIQEAEIIEPVKPTLESLKRELNTLKRKVEEVEDKINELE